MITTAAPRRSRVFEIALVLSILVHLLGLLFYLGWLRQYLVDVQRKTQQQELVATSDIVRLEKRTVPRPEVKRQVTPPLPQVVPRRVAVEKPVVRPTPVQRREIARLVPKAAPLPAVVRPHLVPQSSQPNAQPHVVPRNAIPNDEELAQMFARGIAQSKSDLQNIPAQSQPPSAIRSRSVEIPGVSFHDLQFAEGIVDYVYSSGREGNRNWHIIRVRITYPDGVTELVDVPWRFYFPSNDDPIAENRRRSFPAQAPPPGFVLQDGFAPSRFVCSFYRDRCQALFDAEHNAGGAPAAN